MSCSFLLLYKYVFLRSYIHTFPLVFIQISGLIGPKRSHLSHILSHSCHLSNGLVTITACSVFFYLHIKNLFKGVATAHTGQSLTQSQLQRTRQIARAHYPTGLSFSEFLTRGCAQFSFCLCCTACS